MVSAACVIEGGGQIKAADMSLVRSNITSGKPDHGNRTVNVAIAIAVAVLVVLALLGMNVIALAALALMSLGAILIAADWRVTDKPFVMLV